MKLVVVTIEGAADLPSPALERRTPLEVARCPTATALATEGRCGLLTTSSRLFGRRESLLALCCGATEGDMRALARGPLEFEDQGVEWGRFNYAYAGNFVTIDGGTLREANLSQLSLEETRHLCAAIQEFFDPAEVTLLPVAGGKVVAAMCVEGEPESGVPPWSVDEISRVVLSDRKSELARRVFDKSAQVLERVTINDVRVDLGENPATHLWLWGGGRPAKQPSFQAGRGWKGCMVTNSRLAAGFAKLCRMDRVAMRDPWSEDAEHPAVDTAEFAARLAASDLLVVHIEAPDRSHGYGTPSQKVHLLERADLLVLAPLMEAVRKAGPARVLLVTDGFLPAKAVKAPLAVWGRGVEPDAVTHWDEAACRGGALGAVKAADIYKVLAG